MKKKHLFIALAVIIFCYGLYVVYAMYNKPHQNIAATPADYQLTVNEIFREFSADETQATLKFSDKVIALSGSVNKVQAHEDGPSYVLLTGNGAVVNCEISHENSMEISDGNIGEQLTMKGLFVGYDDLLGEIQLKKCSIIARNLKQ